MISGRSDILARRETLIRFCVAWPQPTQGYYRAGYNTPKSHLLRRERRLALQAGWLQEYLFLASSIASFRLDEQLWYICILSTLTEVPVILNLFCPWR